MDEPELTPALELESAQALVLLAHGELSIEGRLVDASNATLYCAVDLDGVQAACVYKPVSGERPLWDCPDGTLAGREVAAYAVSEATTWGLVPPTLYRDGPLGPGMLQLWIEPDESADVVAMVRDPSCEALRRLAVFDAVINNADRKGGHIIPSRSGAVYGVDHGISFHSEDKLRTVLWQWAGQPMPDWAVEELQRLQTDLAAGLGERLGELLTVREVRRTQARVKALLRSGCHPQPSGDWPAIPWPPF